MQCPRRAITGAAAARFAHERPKLGRRGGSGGGGGRMLQFFAVEIKTGAVRTFFPMSDNLNHDQCSPTDPTLVLYCHEGTWELVDRIWTIRTDGTGARLMHPRTMPMEIAGHEFFGYNGKTVWYDLQTPKSGVFWLAGVNAETGDRIRYPIERAQWSVHYNQSHDGKLFAGDGGGPNGVSNRSPDGARLDPPANGQWIYLFTPRPEKLEMMKVGGEDVKVGKFDVEKLVDLSKHDYSARTESDLHARQPVDRLPLQHARADPRLCRRNSQGEMISASVAHDHPGGLLRGIRASSIPNSLANSNASVSRS